MNLFLALINKAQMNARRCFARVWPFVYRCQVPASRWAFLSNRASYAYKPGLAAIFGKPVCYNVCVGGNSATALFDIVRTA